jgi:hypothetical protein
MTPGFERLYTKKYPPDAYRDEVKAMVRILQQRYGLTAREDAENTAPEAEQGGSPDPEQVGFAF